MNPVRRIARAVWRAGSFTNGERAIPEETAIAFTYTGSSYAVMMATPQDLEDFACGFSLTEAIVGSAKEIEKLDVVEGELGIELRMWLSENRGSAFTERKISFSTSRAAGQTSRRNTGPFFPIPRGSVARSMSMRPANA